MNTIEYGEHCYGSYLIIDGEHTHHGEYDERGEEYIRQLKLKLINELPKMVDKLSTYDLKMIAEIVTQNNTDWEYDEENSKSYRCDQCGNYNHNEVYKKVT